MLGKVVLGTLTVPIADKMLKHRLKTLFHWSVSTETTGCERLGYSRNCKFISSLTRRLIYSTSLPQTNVEQNSVPLREYFSSPLMSTFYIWRLVTLSLLLHSCLLCLLAYGKDYKPTEHFFLFMSFMSYFEIKNGMRPWRNCPPTGKVTLRQLTSFMQPQVPVSSLPGSGGQVCPLTEGTLVLSFFSFLPFYLWPPHLHWWYLERDQAKNTCRLHYKGTDEARVTEAWVARMWRSGLQLSSHRSLPGVGLWTHKGTSLSRGSTFCKGGSCAYPTECSRHLNETLLVKCHQARPQEAVAARNIQVQIDQYFRKVRPSLSASVEALTYTTYHD